ncbi:MAG: choice-of-anchor J domain-containing protein, partial [Bacteroidales bacterium]|nr:choice-of-anchor J domain-containing protein [Bacteroidales bacterium]
FRILYLKNEKFAAGQTDIKKGDDVVILGKLMNYKGNTPETVSGAAYLYSLNGKTEDDGNGGGGTTDETYFTETFEASQGNFTIENKSMPTELTYVWKHDATNKYMKASAYANSTKYATESWLISPEIDLSSAPSAFLSFDHVMRYFGTANQDGTLKVTIDNGANWADVTIPTYPDGTSWTFVSSGEISLASYVGKKIKLAFIYKSSTDAAATWEIKNVKVYKTSTGGNQGGGGGDTGSGITVGLAATSFTADTDATYGAGFKYTSSEGIVIAYYKYNSTTALVNTQSDHIRVYKNAVIVVTAPAGKTIKNLVFNCTYADKTYQMNVLEGGGSTTADTTAKTVTWSGSASKFVGNTVNGQCQFKNVVVTLE